MMFVIKIVGHLLSPRIEFTGFGNSTGRLLHFWTVYTRDSSCLYSSFLLSWNSEIIAKRDKLFSAWVHIYSEADPTLPPVMNNCFSGDAVHGTAPSVHRTSGHVLDSSLDIVAVSDLAALSAFSVEAADTLCRVDQSQHRALNPRKFFLPHFQAEPPFVVADELAFVLVNRLCHLAKIVDHCRSSCIDSHPEK